MNELKNQQAIHAKAWRKVFFFFIGLLKVFSSTKLKNLMMYWENVKDKWTTNEVSLYLDQIEHKSFLLCSSDIVIIDMSQSLERCLKT